MPLILWGGTELLVCIVCASIPVLRPFYKKLRGTANSSAQYELGDTPSQRLETHTKGTAKNSCLPHLGSQRLSGAFRSQPEPATSLGSSSSNTVMAHEHGNFE